ncbi:hypothetical protein GCM10020227_34880 [Streptomyces flavovirens]
MLGGRLGELAVVGAGAEAADEGEDAYRHGENSWVREGVEQADRSPFNFLPPKRTTVHFRCSGATLEP